MVDELVKQYQDALRSHRGLQARIDKLEEELTEERRRCDESYDEVQRARLRLDEAIQASIA